MKRDEDQDIAFIEAYFNMELSEDGTKQFQKRWETDSDFAEKVVHYKRSMDLVNDKYSDKERVERIIRWNHLISDANMESSAESNWKIWVVAITAFLLLIMVAIWSFRSEPNYTRLVAQAWDQRVGLDFVVRNETRDLKPIQLSLDTYDQKAYERALESLKIYDTSDVQYHDVLLLRALSLYQLNRWEESLLTLDSLATYDLALADWYRGLIHLTNGNKEKATEYIQIPESGNGSIKLK
ncbi:MAG: hypothetical protein AAGA77_09880 [Bacteroidota bacterium]